MTDCTGRFLWYELLTTDPEAGRRFYTETFGWKLQKFEGGPPDMDYLMFMQGEMPIGGSMQLPQEAQRMGAPSHWLGHIGTTDVDATVAKARELGAQVLMGPETIPSVGRVSVLADPQGVVFGVYAPETDPMYPESKAQAGQVSWHELCAADWKAAWTFYSTLFNWEKKDEMDMGPGGTYFMYGRKGSDITLGGMYTKSAEMNFPPHWLYYVSCTDMTSTLERIKRQGGTVVNGPMEVPGGDVVAQCMDPQGAAFAVHARATT